jgi:hypothetical protein
VKAVSVFADKLREAVDMSSIEMLRQFDLDGAGWPHR